MPGLHIATRMLVAPIEPRLFKTAHYPSPRPRLASRLFTGAPGNLAQGPSDGWIRLGTLEGPESTLQTVRLGAVQVCIEQNTPM